MTFIVLKIQESDYGCEERSSDYVAMDRVTLRGNEGEVVVEVSDKELYEKGINEGDWVYFDVNDVIYKE